MEQNCCFPALPNQLPHASLTLKKSDCEKLKGNQLRYVYFIDKSYRERLTSPILPFSDIDKAGAGMYKGKAISIQDRKRDKKANSSDQLESGGAVPTITLQPKEKIKELNRERIS